MMKAMNVRIKQGLAAGVAAIATFGAMAATAAPAAADGPGDWFHGRGQTVQNDKNAARNLGIGLGAAAVYEALNGKSANAVVLGAGAVLAAKRYDDDRQVQVDRNRDWEHYRYERDRHDDFRR